MRFNLANGKNTILTIYDPIKQPTGKKRNVRLIPPELPEDGEQ